ncbi:MAG: hypothetical protein ACOYNO_03285 [Saprospiraceae bacterium]|jgi:Uma2 family endonuclease
MNDNLIFMGVNAPRVHQAAITKLIYGLTDLYVKKESDLFAYPETMIDESQTSPAPDVMLIDPKTDLTKVIIEITHTQGVKKDIQKLLELMRDYEVPEGFVFDYKLNIWHKFPSNSETGGINSSWCDAVGRELSGLLF